jgi:hypothetical protein
MLSSQTQLWNSLSWVPPGEVGELVLRKRASSFHTSYHTLFALPSLWAVQAQTTVQIPASRPFAASATPNDPIVPRTGGAGAFSWDDKIAFGVYYMRFLEGGK